jgi:hypothetical protein
MHNKKQLGSISCLVSQAVIKIILAKANRGIKYSKGSYDYDGSSGQEKLKC